MANLCLDGSAGLALEAENTGQPLPLPFALSVEPTAGEAALPDSPTEIAPALWATSLVAALLAPLPTPLAPPPALAAPLPAALPPSLPLAPPAAAPEPPAALPPPAAP